MKQIETITELHGILLEMAKAFHMVCVEENIPYFIVGGTMLGAIRHKGFIPWDDDMDFGVPRAYYERLKEALQRKLPDRYEVLSRESGIILTGFFKIADNRTIHEHSWDLDPSKKFGVNIDIFPLDFASKKWKRTLITYLLKIQNLKSYKASERPLPKRLLAYFIKFLFFFTSKDFFFDIIEKYLIEKEGNYIVNNYGIYGVKEILPSVYFGTPQLYSFEDTFLYGVERWDDYLKTIYGDYMKLPPVDKQHTHITSMYWKD